MTDRPDDTPHGQTPEPEPKRRATRDRDQDRRLAVALGLAAAAVGVAGTKKFDTEGRTDEASESSLFGRSASAAASPMPMEWDLPADRNDRVDFFIEFLITERNDEMREWFARAGKYGPLIREQLREAGLPEDIFYLAMIESGLDPNAYSVAKAAGIWQFIAETGQRYGLEVSSYVDERRDPVKATPAAIRYLMEMHDRFDSWFLASAGYNTGENRVGRIMRETYGSERGPESAYWGIAAKLPRETRDYVPLMLAAAHIAKNADTYGLADVEFEEPLSYDEVRVPRGVSLADVARAAGVDEAAVKELNPHLVRGQTPPDRDWDVRVPVGSARTFAQNFGTGSGPA
jgi:membrane-bound lytic murein transglycosylase D